MSLRNTAARTIGVAITATRVSAETTLRLVRRAPPGGALQDALETADANARKIAARILGEDGLLEGAEHRRRAAPGKRQRSPRQAHVAAKEGRRTQPMREEKPARQRKSRASNGKASARKSAVQHRKAPKAPSKKVRQARPGEAVSGFPEPPGKDPGDISRDPEPHHALSNPVREPDPTEWPDPYENRADPRDPPDPDEQPFGEEPHPATGSMSTSEPHPREDPEAGERQNAPDRDRLDD